MMNTIFLRIILLAVFTLTMSIAGAMYFEVLEYYEDLSDFTADREFVQDSEERVCAALKIAEDFPYDISLEENVYETKNIDGYNYLFFSISNPYITITADQFEPLELTPPEQPEFITGKVYYLQLEANERVDVTFNVEPDYAEILVNGNHWTGERLKPGEHTVDIIAPGHEDFMDTIVLDQPQHTFSYILPPMTFFVSIVTEPEDATVYIDGMEWEIDTGVLEPGSYVVTIEKEGYQSIEDIIEISDSDAAFSYTLVPEE